MNPVLELRRGAGLTQAELAVRSGVAQPNIAAYESGRRRPSAVMVERLRHAASAPPHMILAAHRTDLLRLAAEHGMHDVRVFGSTARHTDAAGSDVDLLVRAAPRTGLMSISAFALQAENLLGVRVDVVTEGGLLPGHPILLEAVSL